MWVKTSAGRSLQMWRTRAQRGYSSNRKPGTIHSGNLEIDGLHLREGSPCHHNRVWESGHSMEQANEDVIRSQWQWSSQKGWKWRKWWWFTHSVPVKFPRGFKEEAGLHESTFKGDNVSVMHQGLRGDNKRFSFLNKVWTPMIWEIIHF